LTWQTHFFVSEFFIHIQLLLPNYALCNHATVMTILRMNHMLYCLFVSGVVASVMNVCVCGTPMLTLL